MDTMTSKLSGCLCTFSNSCADPPERVSEAKLFGLDRLHGAFCPGCASSETKVLDVPAESNAQGLKSGYKVE
eukprot:1142264-Pelagomonas_calceolata.AAC.7